MAENFRVFVRFAGVGAIGTVAHYLTLIILVEGFQTGPISGSSLGFIVGAFVNYHLNYRFTFRSSRNHLEAMPRFFLVAFVGFGFNGLIMWLLADQMSIGYLLSQICATGAVLVWTFIANRKWTFTK